MTITKEKINGVEHTVVNHEAVDPMCWTVWKRNNVGWSRYTTLTPVNSMGSHIATALPALPKNPQPSDAALLHLYAAHGLMVVSEVIGNDSNRTIRSYVFVGSGRKGIYTEKNPPYDCTDYLDWFADYPITHAVDESGNRVEVAIEG